MTLYECHAKGVYGSGRAWSFRQYFNSPATLATVSTDWSAQVTAAWTDGTHGLQTLYPTATSLEGTTTYQLSVIAGTPGSIIAVASQDTVSVHAGTSANDGLPDQDAVLVSLRTATAGPNGRGRTYLPAIDETVVVGGIINSTPATRVTTAMTALRTGMAAAGHVQILLNRKSTKRDPAIGTTKPVTLCKTDRVMRTQRRRIRKELAQYV